MCSSAKQVVLTKISNKREWCDGDYDDYDDVVHIWLIVCAIYSGSYLPVMWCLRRRFAIVVWSPGNTALSP
jgi:hypothetical protein